MNPVRRPPVQHPLAPAFDHAVDSFCASLNPDTTRHYGGTVRNFLLYIAEDHPDVNSLASLRRDPHILSWMSRLRSQQPPLVTASYINRLLALRCILTELAWMNQLTDLAHFIRSDDIPRLPQRLPGPLTPEQDQLLQREFIRRNDSGSNALLLIRHTGMRIGECADLSLDASVALAPISGLSIYLSANSKLNGWFQSIHSCVTSSSACVSFVPSIHCLKTASFCRVHIAKKRSFVNSGSTCIKSATT